MSREKESQGKYWIAEEDFSTREETKEDESEENTYDYLDLDQMLASVCARIYEEPEPENESNRRGNWCCSCQQTSRQSDLLEVKVRGGSKKKNKNSDSSSPESSSH